MIETFAATSQPVPKVSCEQCGMTTASQAYSILLIRPKVTREWFFCSLDHLRVWAEPIKN